MGAVGQLHHALDQLQGLQFCVQPGTRAAILDIEQIAQDNAPCIPGLHTELGQAADIHQRIVLRRHRGHDLQGFTDIEGLAQQFGVVACADLGLDRQGIEVVEQIDVGLQQALPLGQAQIDLAAQQCAHQCIEQRRT
ncbi:hypothetical protein D9M71_391050 [compost metagenome]